MPRTDVLGFALPQSGHAGAAATPGATQTYTYLDAPYSALGAHDSPYLDSPSSSLPSLASLISPPLSSISLGGKQAGAAGIESDAAQLERTASLGRDWKLGQAYGEGRATAAATATATATATVKSQGGFPQYGSGPFGGRDSVAIPLLCIASLALAAGIVVFTAWRRMERRKTRREAKRDLSALQRSTLYVGA